MAQTVHEVQLVSSSTHHMPTLLRQKSRGCSSNDRFIIFSAALQCTSTCSDSCLVVPNVVLVSPMCSRHCLHSLCSWDEKCIQHMLVPCKPFCRSNRGTWCRCNWPSGAARYVDINLQTKCSIC
jgi:hypothetical protein